MRVFEPKASRDEDQPQAETLQISFVIPCLNESQTIQDVIEDCKIGGQNSGCSYEIIIADNGSTDGSQDIAKLAEAKVIDVEERGYGAALQKGIECASGEVIIMGDADRTYNFQQADQFIKKIKEENCALVMGNRFKGEIEPGAMPRLHYYLGNPVLSFLGRTFFGITIGDFHCGLRAFSRREIQNLRLSCTGMEFASEMVIKASLMELSMSEIPTTLKKDPPNRKPHLKTWRDGWRHLKFMLSFAPKYNLLPLASLFLFISIALFALYQAQIAPFTGTNTLVFSASSIVLALNIVSDFVLTQEMLYAKFKPSKQNSMRRTILGLSRGTDRIFKISAFALGISTIAFLGLLREASLGALSTIQAQTFGFTGCVTLILSATSYQTACKLTSFKSLSQKSKI